ncbi:MAG TPA: TerC/Alx family metal homeostasis membrane protein [Vicinamibacterales bacterium]|jgi:tellurite resistance protein TerC|nr:TerC/Alx family metal homeostasis membrane protein [Vicinamibacterales bacterium]
MASETKIKTAAPSITSRNVRRVAFWIAVGLAFGVWVAVAHGATAAAEYYAAYLLELSLSVDNIFVFVIVFSELHIPAEHQRRVLGWGITSALVFRAVMIGAGIALVQRVQWIMYPFGALILFAAWRMLFAEERERRVVAGACDVCATWIARVVPVSPALHGDDFWRREGGRLVATPLFVALAVIETTDIVFALDSVPAVLAITRNPLIVYSSNVLAMFGLRSLYFVVSDVLDRLRYLRQGLAAVLVFTGAKMIGSEWVHISPVVSVGIIAFVLGVTIALSLWPRRSGK